MELQLFNYNGNNVSFRKEGEDVFVNATEMAKPFGKKPIDYLRLTSTVELIEAKVRKNHFAQNQLVITDRGGLNPCTWLHEDLAIDFAQWLSVDFRLWVADRIKELMKFGMTATPQTLENLVSNPDLLIDLATALKHERAANENLAIRNQQQSLELKNQAPKIEYFDEVLQSQSTYNTNQIAKELGTSAVSLNKFLAKQKIQYKQGETWLLYHQFQNKGYTKTRTHPYTGDNGEIKTRMLTVWTEAGRLFIHKVFEKHSEQFGNFLIR